MRLWWRRRMDHSDPHHSMSGKSGPSIRDCGGAGGWIIQILALPRQVNRGPSMCHSDPHHFMSGKSGPSMCHSDPHHSMSGKSGPSIRDCGGAGGWIIQIRTIPCQVNQGHRYEIVVEQEDGSFRSAPFHVR
jgi:hypothetical protein